MFSPQDPPASGEGATRPPQCAQATAAMAKAVSQPVTRAPPAAIEADVIGAWGRATWVQTSDRADYAAGASSATISAQRAYATK